MIKNTARENLLNQVRKTILPASRQLKKKKSREEAILPLLTDHVNFGMDYEGSWKDYGLKQL